MKILKTASGKRKIKLSKKEWEDIGKKAGWNPFAARKKPSSFEEGSKIEQCKGCNRKMRKAYLDDEGYCKECYDGMKNASKNGVVKTAYDKMTITNGEVDKGSVEISGVDPSDYPDFSDAYVSAAYFVEGGKLTEADIEEFEDRYRDFINQEATEQCIGMSEYASDSWQNR